MVHLFIYHNNDKGKNTHFYIIYFIMAEGAVSFDITQIVMEGVKSPIVIGTSIKSHWPNLMDEDECGFIAGFF